MEPKSGFDAAVDAVIAGAKRLGESFPHPAHRDAESHRACLELAARLWEQTRPFPPLSGDVGSCGPVPPGTAFGSDDRPETQPAYAATVWTDSDPPPGSTRRAGETRLVVDAANGHRYCRYCWYGGTFFEETRHRLTADSTLEEVLAAFDRMKSPEPGQWTRSVPWSGWRAFLKLDDPVTAIEIDRRDDKGVFRLLKKLR